MNSKKIEDKVMASVELRELLVYSLSKKTLLLELFTIIGVGNTLKLITFFGGGDLQLPSKYEVRHHIKQVVLYQLFAKEGYSIRKLKNNYKSVINQKEIDNCIARMSKLEKQLQADKAMCKEIQTVDESFIRDIIDMIEQESIENHA